MFALRANWWGLFGERFHRRFGRISRNEVLSGIVGSPTNHFDVPFSLTEEFVAVYRMHPMIRTTRASARPATTARSPTLTFPQLAGPAGLRLLDRLDLADLLYSFGTLHPGVVCLHNYPRFLQEFERPDGQLMDLAAVDIMRSREVGVPRYNEFRRLMHLAPAKDFEDMTDNPLWARGAAGASTTTTSSASTSSWACTPSAGRRASPSATRRFRVFVLMASRRLNSDRFFTDDYRPEIYTPEGIDWIADNTLKTVLLRHYPQLRPALRGRDNAFAPWVAARG